MLQPIFYCRNVDATRRSGSDRCQRQMLVKNRDFFPSWGGSLSEYCHNVVTFGTEKTRAVWLPDGENFFEDMFIRFDRIHQRDRQTE